MPVRRSRYSARTKDLPYCKSLVFTKETGGEAADWVAEGQQEVRGETRDSLSQDSLLFDTSQQTQRTQTWKQMRRGSVSGSRRGTQDVQLQYTPEKSSSRPTALMTATRYTLGEEHQELKVRELKPPVASIEDIPSNTTKVNPTLGKEQCRSGGTNIMKKIRWQGRILSLPSQKLSDFGGRSPTEENSLGSPYKDQGDQGRMSKRAGLMDLAEMDTLDKRLNVKQLGVKERDIIHMLSQLPTKSDLVKWAKHLEPTFKEDILALQQTTSPNSLRSKQLIK